MKMVRCGAWIVARGESSGGGGLLVCLDLNNPEKGGEKKT